MERKQLVFDEIKLSDIDERYSCLDDWNNYYDWRVYKNDYLYLLEDKQTGELEHYTYLFELIERISSRALDYETDEMEYNTDEDDNALISINRFNYLNNLLYCYMISNTEFNNDWFNFKLKYIRDLKIESESNENE